MSIKKIVADYETCKKASTIGLHLKTIFHWIDVTPYMEEGRQAVYCIEEIFPNFHSMQPSEEEKNSFIIDMGFEEYTYLSLSAPTAEEVPLPKMLYQPPMVFNTCYNSDNLLLSYTNDGYNNIYWQIYKIMNEATARLKMAIWLIENVPEAKQWYVDNNYLRGDNAE